MRPSMFLGFIVLVSSSRAAEPVDTATAQRSIQRSVSWLETDMQTWRTDHGCAACHHGPMYLWSIHVAKGQGYSIDEQTLAANTTWLLTSDEARIFPKMEMPAQVTVSSADRMTADMRGHKNLSQPTIYLTHALNAVPDQNPLKKLGWQKVIAHLAASQHENGSFVGRDAWRPIFNTPQILTRFVVSGLRDAGQREELPKSQQGILEAAQDFLAGQVPDASHQGLVLRILSEPKVREQSTTLAAGGLAELVLQLKQRQRGDGGWAQTADRDSDAFATGQSLVALHRAGVTRTDPAVQRAVQYLLRTQQVGTWPMTSRPNPENGRPAEFLNPITYAATAWATIGLASYFPNIE